MQKRGGSIARHKNQWRGRVQIEGKVYSFLGATKEDVQAKMDEALRNNPQPAAPKIPKIEEDERTENNWTMTRQVSHRVMNEKDLAKVCKIDLTEWEIERWKCSKWEVVSVPRTTRKTTKDKWVRPSSKPVTTPMFAVQVWLKKKKLVQLVRQELEDIKKSFLRDVPKAPHHVYTIRPEGLALEVSLADHHFGKVAWPKETGWEPYDLKIAQRIYEEASTGLLERTSGYKFEKIVLVVGNDILHIDNRSQRTESGTQLDTDSRYHKIFRVARQCVMDQIHLYREIAPVHVVVVSGNHDYHAAWHLGDSLQVAFAGHKDITVDVEPRPRKYWEWGNVAVMWTHGHKAKRKGELLPQVFAAEEPSLFGRTKFREIHLGQYHHLQVQELFGTTVRILPSLCAADAWHAEHEFVGSLRRSEALVWDKTDGLVGSAFYTVRREYS